jgi:protein TonB
MANSSNSNAGSQAALTKFIPIAVIALALIVVLYFFLSGGSKAPAPTAAAPSAKTAPAGAVPGAPAGTPAEPVPELTKEQLRREAGAALRENRLVAPAGNNALEYYLRILDKDPNNATAKDALREMFPIVTGPVQQSINNGGLDEATRVIDLLPRRIRTTTADDPAQQTHREKQVERERHSKLPRLLPRRAGTQAALPPRQQFGCRANNPQRNPPPPRTLRMNDSTAAAGSNAGSAQRASLPRRRFATRRRRPPAAAAAFLPAETHAAEIIKTSPPDYPPDALPEGWSKSSSQFGRRSVTNATVINANRHACSIPRR